MFEDILTQLSSFSPIWIYITLFLFAFVENVFPPSPSDVVLLIGGTIIATGVINFIFSLIISTAGSIFGFLLMFYFGSTIDRRVVESGKYKFIPVDGIHKVERWFRKYGYYVVVANRFLPGTRAIISFFAGISNLDIKKTTLLCGLSALAWNAILLYLGYVFGDNVELVDSYMTTYSNIVIAITILIILFLAVRIYFRKRKAAN
ncbi:MAG: DedA family protein [Ignavibacteria bacterium]|nr:DedA family protein [Ignavibacteria bacterium]MBT8382478.1 DedA family protein [Ignavibacteria bacterium]MBT8391815.1 DedA family protein [Ignavibacteria bacterium]NNJ51876.1 DedA family protein [Ignavibacteriaceae bacterium]NNL21915.1 DedA family protein [Ignavibacteriaceae bacterium]